MDNFKQPVSFFSAMAPALIGSASLYAFFFYIGYQRGLPLTEMAAMGLGVCVFYTYLLTKLRKAHYEFYQLLTNKETK
ncbi:hypothetical protein G3R49_19330 [Shewanella sp. WXL01]|uniref:hypothetical protein n=1 Tax=Shewanella sp. WXL01 TaxID=2709721 RepID=UPI0014383283|nr:hypothetical protein [Shewanella sp. WXL01]NKF52712.1 hypothetical protein [Shewanella sp. WXL01]